MSQMHSSSIDPTATSALTVFYDGGCPLCRREIAFWRRRRGADAIDWIDLTSLPGDNVRPGLSKTDAIARFHVEKPDGTLVSGARAFAALWRAIPATRLAGRMMTLPGVIQVLEFGYTIMLKVRPLWRPSKCNDDVCTLH